MTVAPIGKNHRLSRLLLKQPDVRYVNYSIVLTPIRHFVCEITIYEQAQQSGFVGAWSVYGLWSLDAPRELEGFVGAGIPIQKSGPMTVMAVVPPTSYDVFREQVEAEILPYLRTLNSMEKLYAESMRCRQELMSDSPDTPFQLELVMGHFDVALQLLARHREAWFDEPVDYFDQENIGHVRELCRLLEADNRSGLAALFHKREADNVRRRKLTRLWERTPFPFEAGPTD